MTKKRQRLDNRILWDVSIDTLEFVLNNTAYRKMENLYLNTLGPLKTAPRPQYPVWDEDEDELYDQYHEYRANLMGRAGPRIVTRIYLGDSSHTLFTLDTNVYLDGFLVADLDKELKLTRTFPKQYNDYMDKLAKNLAASIPEYVEYLHESEYE